MIVMKKRGTMKTRKENGVAIPIRDSTSFVKKLIKPCLIRYRRFASPDVARVDYFRMNSETLLKTITSKFA